MERVTLYLHRHKLRPYLQQVKTKNSEVYRIAKNKLEGVYADIAIRTWTDNKVREVANVCLPWQHWTKTVVWFDDVDISVLHSCVVVYLWHSLSEWHLLVSACVLVCRRCRSLN